MTLPPAQTSQPNPALTPPGTPLPRIIQGGMGVAISDWRLAKAVSLAGGLGVVSGTGIDNLLVRRLQDGDTDTLRALAHFPDQERARKVIGWRAKATRTRSA